MGCLWTDLLKYYALKSSKGCLGTEREFTYGFHPVSQLSIAEDVSSQSLQLSVVGGTSGVSLRWRNLGPHEGVIVEAGPLRQMRLRKSELTHKIYSYT